MLSIVDWRITHLCNNKCKYCYGSKPIPAMSNEQENTVVSKIINSDIGIVNITGGEPMLDDQRCRELIKKLYDGGKKVYLSTNGFEGTENTDFISKYVSLLGLPLDGYSADTQTVCGRNPESFDEVVNLLSVIDGKGTFDNVKIGTVVTKLNCNINTLLKIYDIISRYNCVKVWRLYEFIPVNRGEQHSDIALTARDRGEIEKAVLQLRTISERIKIEFATRKNRGSSYFIIQPDGSVIVPVERGEKSYEEPIGSLITEDFNTLLPRWKKYSCDGEYLSLRAADVTGEDK